MLFLLAPSVGDGLGGESKRAASWTRHDGGELREGQNTGTIKIRSPDKPRRAANIMDFPETCAASEVARGIEMRLGTYNGRLQGSQRKGGCLMDVCASYGGRKE